MVVAYLMKLRGWRLAEAYKWVKDKRPAIKISPGVPAHTPCCLGGLESPGAHDLQAPCLACGCRPGALCGGHCSGKGGVAEAAASGPLLASPWASSIAVCAWPLPTMVRPPSRAPVAAEAKRLTDYELQLHGSCSVPFGLAAVTMPGALPTAAASPPHVPFGQQQQPHQAALDQQHSRQQHPGRAAPWVFSPSEGAANGGGGSSSAGAPPAPSQFVFGGPAPGGQVAAAADASEQMES